MFDSRAIIERPKGYRWNLSMMIDVEVKNNRWIYIYIYDEKMMTNQFRDIERDDRRSLPVQ